MALYHWDINHDSYGTYLFHTIAMKWITLLKKYIYFDVISLYKDEWEGQCDWKMENNLQNTSRHES